MDAVTQVANISQQPVEPVDEILIGGRLVSEPGSEVLNLCLELRRFYEQISQSCRAL